MRDLHTFISYRQDQSIARFQGWQPDFSLEQGIELIASQQGVFLPEPGEWLQLGIHKRESGEHMGDLAIHAVNAEADCYELGFTIATAHQGNGYAQEAARAIISHLRARSAAKRFVANTDSRNLPSIKVLLALGFELQPTRGWTETFKDELVTMEYFETT